MSRITAPVSKLARTIGSNATTSISRPSSLLGNTSKSAVSASRKLDLGDHHHPSETHENGSARHLTTLTPSHRPQPTPSPSRTIPLMQTFTTASAARARLDSSAIDYAVMPSRDALFPSSSSEPALRMPLLPDSFNVSHKPDTPDGPVAMPEISVVAAHPENVSAVSALTEVEGMAADGVELRFVHELEKPKVKEGGMIRDLWKGLMDDVFGEESKGRPAV